MTIAANQGLATAPEQDAANTREQAQARRSLFQRDLLKEVVDVKDWLAPNGPAEAADVIASECKVALWPLAAPLDPENAANGSALEML